MILILYTLVCHLAVDATASRRTLLHMYRRTRAAAMRLMVEDDARLIDSFASRTEEMTGQHTHLV